jgi:hypothetical protein
MILIMKNTVSLAMEYVFYKIVCDDLDIKYTYVGSTKNFKGRKRQHRFDSNNIKKVHLKLYSVIKEHGGLKNWDMVEIETCICDSTWDAHTRERWWYEKLNANLNTYRPQCTSEENKSRTYEQQKQYKIDNKDAIAAYNREYAMKNKEKESARDSQRIHCDACDCEVNRSSKSKHSKTKKHLDSIALIQNEVPTKLQK